MILTIALSHNLTHGCRKRCETLRSITCFHLHFVALLKDQIIGLLATPHFEEGTSELLACKYNILTLEEVPQWMWLCNCACNSQKYLKVPQSMCKEKGALASRFPLFVDPVFKLNCETQSHTVH